MKIRIIAIGHVKDSYLKEGINEYLTRLKHYTQIENIELDDEAVNDNPKEKEIEIVKNKEGSKVMKIIKDSDYIIALDLNKKEMTSPEFASYLDKKFVQANSNITFIIGGSYGLSDELKARANDSISLSKMTFLHQMSKLILLEQIYRAFKINRNETYHK